MAYFSSLHAGSLQEHITLPRLYSRYRGGNRDGNCGVGSIQAAVPVASGNNLTRPADRYAHQLLRKARREEGREAARAKTQAAHGPNAKRAPPGRSAVPGWPDLVLPLRGDGFVLVARGHFAQRDRGVVLGVTGLAELRHAERNHLLHGFA